MNEDQVKQLVAAMVKPEALRPQPEPAAPEKDAGTRVAEEAVGTPRRGAINYVRVEDNVFPCEYPKNVNVASAIRDRLAARVNAAIAEAVAADREQRKAEAAPAQPQPEPAKGRTPGKVEAERIVSEATSSDSDEIYLWDWRVRTIGGEPRDVTITALRIRISSLINRTAAESAKAMRERCAKWLEQVAYMTTWAREVRNLPLE